jgi:hypothetical protein
MVLYNLSVCIPILSLYLSLHVNVAYRVLLKDISSSFIFSVVSQSAITHGSSGESLDELHRMCSIN